MIVRPSGTEPKLKCYLEVVVPVDPEDGVDAARISAAGRLDALARRHQGGRGHLTPVVSAGRATQRRPRSDDARVDRQRRRSPARPSARAHAGGQRRLLVGERRDAAPRPVVVGELRDPVSDEVGVGQLRLVATSPSAARSRPRPSRAGSRSPLSPARSAQDACRSRARRSASRRRAPPAPGAPRPRRSRPAGSTLVSSMLRSTRSLGVDPDRGPQQRGYQTSAANAAPQRPPAPRSRASPSTSAQTTTRRGQHRPPARRSPGRWSAGTSRRTRVGAARVASRPGSSPRPSAWIPRSSPHNPMLGRVTSSPTIDNKMAGVGGHAVPDFSDITAVRRPRCAASCTACPASTRSAPRPARPSLGTRSIKTTAKAYAIDLAIRMVDLTTLEGQDTHGKVRALAAKAMHPDPADPTCPATAAVCVYPDMVATAKETPRRQRRHVAAVATAFPSGRAALDIKLADTRTPSRPAPTRSTWSSTAARSCPGRYSEVYDEIVAVREAVRRTRPPQGDLRDRRAADLRQRPPRQLAGDDGRRPLHQDLHRQGAAGRDAAGHAGDARGGPRLPRADRPDGRREAGRRHPDHQGRDQVPRDGQRGRRPRLARPRLVPLRRLHAAQRPADAAHQDDDRRYSGPDYFTLD